MLQTARNRRRRSASAAGCLVAVLTAALTAGCLGGGDKEELDPMKNADAKEFTLTISQNAIKTGKNAEGAKWVEDWVIPNFVKAQKEKGVDATVEFKADGADETDYKNTISLDMEAGEAADVIDVDGIWIGEFAESDFIRPLEEVVGAETLEGWDGWDQIPDSVEQNAVFDGDMYGVPTGTDGRVIFYNKEVFKDAGLPEDWQPTSWEDMLEAARAIADETDGVTPLQLNAGTAMGEATTMQGFLPMLAGLGAEIYADDTWQGNTKAVRDVLGLYEEVYSEDLGDPVMQQEAKGRDRSFQRFSEGKVGMLLEGDYFWRDVISPDGEVAPMKDRDEDVGYAKIPAFEPGAGVNGQDFVSMSGGSTRVINPDTEYPQQAWELMEFMNSYEAQVALLGDQPRITHREDVNSEVLADDDFMSFVAEEVVPLTLFRASLGDYPRVSTAVQEATYAVVDGVSVEEAAETYQSELESIVGDDKIATG
ncbi:MAG: extracellular solute-binding protein [Stackebrandtia sp.]